jgi:hypothetical protein
LEKHKLAEPVRYSPILEGGLNIKSVTTPFAQSTPSKNPEAFYGMDEINRSALDNLAGEFVQSVIGAFRG